MKFREFIGIDISKSTMDIAILTADNELAELKCLNQKALLKQTLEGLFDKYKIDRDTVLICGEHTGHFGNILVEVCRENDLKLWMESPYNILHSQGLKRGKNDKIDALRIMEYAKRFCDKAQIYQYSSKNIEILARLSAERDLLVKDISKYKCQLKQEEGFFDKTYFKDKVKRLNRLIKFNEKVLSEIEIDIDSIIKNDIQVKTNFEKIISVEGIGKQTALATIIATGNFTKFQNSRQFVCHAGCAPFKYESGTSRSSRNKVSNRANKNLKRLFHMAALSTLRTQGELRQYYDRKTGEGKNKMSVINAIRAKLITRIFSVIKEDRKYDKFYKHTLV
jgi:transposase